MPQEHTQTPVVPRLVRFSGAVKDSAGKPLTGVVGVTFSIYRDQEGGAPLWLETQNVQLDDQGHYTVLLGATKSEGVPVELFNAAESRWLGVQGHGIEEPPRVLLVSVPYALKAADAEALGGKPVSAFLLKELESPSGPATSGAGLSGKATQPGTSAGSKTVAPAVAGAIAANFIPVFINNAGAEGSSVISQDPTTNNIGVGTTNPVRTLDVAGEIGVRGGNIFMQRNLTDLPGRRNWGWGTETFNVGDWSLFVSTSNTSVPTVSVVTALSNGNVGIGATTPGQRLSVAGTVESTAGGFKFPDATVQTTAGAALSASSNTFTGSITASSFTSSGAGFTGNGFGLTALNATNLTTGTVDDARLSTNVPLLSNASNKFAGTLILPANGLVVGGTQLVASGGNVGIGTASPSTFSQLNVVATTSPIGIIGQTSAAGGASGVSGESFSTASLGVIGQNFGGGGTPTFDTFNIGVAGQSNNGIGVDGSVISGIGVRGRVVNVAGVAGQFDNPAGGNILVGAVSGVHKFRIDGSGNVFANGTYISGGADFAESVEPVGGKENYQPGDVLVIDRMANRRVGLSQQPYSPLVAGVYSTKPGVFARPHGIADPQETNELPVAVVGIVPCKVSAENGPIEIGDLLVTSSMPGHAMKGTERSRMLGAVVGKALEPFPPKGGQDEPFDARDAHGKPLKEGTGLIQVLITLQ